MLKDIRGMRRRVKESLADSETDDDAAPGAKRRWRDLGRRDRDGLATNELVVLIAVIGVLALAGTVGFLIVRAVTSGSEHSVVQQNIEQVAGIADSYWDQFAADVDGRRKINLGDFCEYANNQLAAEDLNLRTLQFGNASAVQAQPSAAANALVESVAASDNNGARARCTARDVTSGGDATEATQEEWYADIIVFDGNTAGTTPATGAAQLTGTVDPAIVARDSGAQNEQQLADALDSVSLRSTRTVWMALYGTGAALTNFAPAGTDTTFDPDNANPFERGVEYLVLGGVAPDGASFCLVKVFDASDATNIGNWYSARLPQADNSFTVCAQGTNVTTGDARVVRGSWPEPR